MANAPSVPLPVLIPCAAFTAPRRLSGVPLAASITARSCSPSEANGRSLPLSSGAGLPLPSGSACPPEAARSSSTALIWLLISAICTLSWVSLSSSPASAAAFACVTSAPLFALSSAIFLL